MTHLAGEPGDDCYGSDSSRPIHQNKAKAKGTVKSIANLKTYVASPSALSNRILLFFSDVHGPFHINNQLLMDYFASKGYLVLSPDYFEGYPVQMAKQREDFDPAAWIQASFSRAKRLCPSWITEVLEQFEDTSSKIGAVGYCFGAPFVLDLCKSNNVVFGAIAHPAFVEEDDFRNIIQPLLISCAETDNTFTSEARHRSEEILKEVHACYLYELFSGVRHGFALRGVMESAWARKHCADSFISWADRFMVESFSSRENYIDEADIRKVSEV